MKEIHHNRIQRRAAEFEHRTALRSTWRGFWGIAFAVMACAGCRSDDGSQRTRIDVLKPSEWFSSADHATEEPEPESGISGKTRGDISVPPMPPPLDAASPPTAPAASGNSYYGVQRTGSRKILGGESTGSDSQEPKLRPVPGAYD